MTVTHYWHTNFSLVFTVAEYVSGFCLFCLNAPVQYKTPAYQKTAARRLLNVRSVLPFTADGSVLWVPAY